MPLDDREQRILEEIERQFYQEDPKLAETVRDATLASVAGHHAKWAALGFVAGVALDAGVLHSDDPRRPGGFVVMVVSVVWMVAILRRRSGVGASAPGSVVGRLRRRWRSRLESPTWGSTESSGTLRPGDLEGERKVLEGFTAQQACRLTGVHASPSCATGTASSWSNPPCSGPGGRPGRRRLYTFRDLVALRVVRSLLDNGMSVQRVRRAWDYLRRTADMDRHLAEVKLITDGQSIFRIASDDDELIDALREGQLAFFVAIDEITREVEEDVSRFELDREQFLEMLRRVEDDVQAEAAGA